MRADTKLRTSGGGDGGDGGDGEADRRLERPVGSKADEPVFLFGFLGRPLFNAVQCSQPAAILG